MEVEDYFSNGKRWWVRLHEKGGKRHEMLAHHKLEQFLDEYLDAAAIRDPAGGGVAPAMFPPWVRVIRPENFRKPAS